jgi:putative transposase
VYSYEDRIRAVELYIRLGKRVRATIFQLGYPTKNALKGWHREYEKRLDLLVGSAVRGPKFTQAQKEAADRFQGCGNINSITLLGSKTAR